VCDICNKPTKFITFQEGYRTYCSIKCVGLSENRMNKIENTNLKRYGTKHFNNTKKRKKTNLEKYGVDHVFQSESIKQKINQSKLEEYGNEKYNNREKCKLTKLENHGNEYYSNTKKAQQTNLEKYGAKTFSESFITNIENLNKNYIESNFIDDKGYIIIKDLMVYYNLSMSVIYKTLKKLNINYKTRTSKSHYEIELYEFLQSNGIENIKLNDRCVISPLELDIYLPDYKLAIEFNGIYWHSEQQ